jgi:predicted molibdopterin-dependent oxidoreductase YjgC
MYPVPEIWINPQTAEKYGIEQGDWTYVSSKRGRITAKAYVTQGIHPGVVCMERFWNPETLDTKTHGWKEMNVNVLTKSTAPFNDVVGTYTLRAFQVKIEKAPGAPEGVWTKPEDFKSWLPMGNGPVPDASKKEAYGKNNYGVHAPAARNLEAGKEDK